MKLLQRIKNGANKATERAQHAVEIGKLNNQIVGLQQEQEVHFTDMGRIFYEGYRAQDMTRAEKKWLICHTCAMNYRMKLMVCAAKLPNSK